MTAQFELERILDDFLGEGTDELSADVLEAALLDVRYTDQRRAHPVPRRTDDVSPPLRLLARTFHDPGLAAEFCSQATSVAVAVGV